MLRMSRDKFPRRYVNPGSSTKIKHKLVIDPDGNRYLEESGVEDTYERIQSFKDGCTIENIVRRALNGDPNALSKAQGVYMDTTLLPDNLITAHEAVKRAEAIYKALPASKRQEFGSFREFIGKFGTLEGIQEVFGKASEPTPAAPAAPAAPEGGNANE